MIAAKIKGVFPVLSFRLGLTQGLVKLQNVFSPGKKDTFRILNYHRVNDFNDPFTIDSVAAADFENQMRYISKHYRVLALDDIYDYIAGNRRLPGQCLAVTFDDGYADNYTFAYPILKKYNLPATIFLTVNCIETQASLWFDQILSAFKATHKKRFACPITEAVFKMDSIEEKLHAARIMLEQLKKPDNAQRKKFVPDVLKELGISSTKAQDASNLLTWTRIKEMGHHNVTFGSHTMTHPILANLPASELDWELTTSCQVIEQKIDKAVRFFAYPNGKPRDFNESIVQVIKQAGYKAAVTTVPEINTPDTNPFSWGRYRPWQNKVDHFSLALFMHGLSVWQRNTDKL